MSPLSHEYSGHPPGTGPILTEVECLTTERRLIECNYKSYSNTCTHASDAGVQCMDGGKRLNITIENPMIGCDE